MLALALTVALAAPVPVATPAASAAAQASWQATIDRVVPAVVAIRVTQTRDFDTEDAGTSFGTGFVVDAEKGILLTNRHMVHAGPVVATAIFENHEEVDLIPIYRDPIHDFGFYKFDPKQVEHQKVVALDLAPDGARVGMEIRVIGNDAGEKLSILDGTLARLDREAPDYGSDTYNDFNTFYVQAASNTSGGSSGSPVVDIDGRVVALNAGGSNRAASSFYLPLYRVVTALAALERGEGVARGTLGIVYEYHHFEETERLGLPAAVEDRARARWPDGTGLLVVSESVPGTSGADVVESGDVLESVDGTPIGDFVTLEALLDAKVGKTVHVVSWRGEKMLEADVLVEDLHALAPDRYLETGRSILHDVSFHQAKNHGVNQDGVYVAAPGYWLGLANVPEGAVITEADGVPVSDVDDFRAEVETRADGEQVRLRWHPIDEPRRSMIAVATIERTWFPTRSCTRNDASGLWPCVASPPPPQSKDKVPATVSFDVDGPKVARTLGSSFVVVDFDIPYPTAGLKEFNYLGAGLVIDAQRGLVVVDRDTVPVVIGDMTLTFAGAVRVPGHVVYLHPLHDFAIVKYDPALLGDTPVTAVEFADDDVEVDDKLWQVGIDSDYRVSARRSRVSTYEALDLGIAGTPRFRDANVEGISMYDNVSSLGGALCDDKGRVVAMWASFVDQATGDRTFYGLPSRYLKRIVDPIRAGQDPAYRALGFEVVPTSLVEARERGLSQVRADTIFAKDPSRREVLEIRRVAAGMPANLALRDGDLLLDVDGEPMLRVRDLEAFTSQDSVNLHVLRDGAELDLTVDTAPTDGRGTDRIVSWAGLIVHAPHLEVGTQQQVEPTGVYSAWLWFGSPGATYGLRPTRRIVEVNGTVIPDLNTFVSVVKGLGEGSVVKVKSVGLDGKILVQALVLDVNYWPGFEIVRDGDDSWKRVNW